MTDPVALSSLDSADSQHYIECACLWSAEASLAQFQVGWVLVVNWESPLDLRLVVEADHQVGHQLEEILPQAQEDVQVEVADVHLAVDAGVVQVAHALEMVHIVEAEASVHTRFRDTFVHILLTPAD